jgi:hypothetical protein
MSSQEQTMPRITAAICWIPVALLLAGMGAEDPGPRYTAAGALDVPNDYREWVFLSSGLDMSYADKPGTMDQSLFDNVFVNPDAWVRFKQTGHWPDKTIFVMETRVASTKGSINKAGHFQTEERVGIEMHVRDAARFKGGWGFFATDGAQPAELLPETATCYGCHQTHGAVDTTFTQFYPTAKPIAVHAGTFLAR